MKSTPASTPSPAGPTQGGDGDSEGRPVVYTCSDCAAPIPNLPIAVRCECCSSLIGVDFGMREVSRELLVDLADKADGCLRCGGSTDRAFCSVPCHKQWFDRYTTAWRRSSR